MKRRTVLIGGLVTLGAGALAMHKVGPKADTRVIAFNRLQGHVDVQHLVTPHFVAGVDPNRIWKAADALNHMDEVGIAISVLSIDPDIYLSLTAPEAYTLARKCNEYLAQQVKAHPSRFRMLASIPLHDTLQAVAELNYAITELGALGASVTASHGGAFLGDPIFNPLLVALDESEAAVMILPGKHPTTDELLLSTEALFVEHTCEITRAAVNLIFTKSLDYYPNIRWVLSNDGGFLPYIAWRLSLANLMPELKDTTEQGILHYLARFWIATSSDSVTQATLKELYQSEKLLLGSGYPIAVFSTPDPALTRNAVELFKNIA